MTVFKFTVRFAEKTEWEGREIVILKQSEMKMFLLNQLTKSLAKRLTGMVSIIALAVFASACSVSTNIPVGTIPEASPPSKQKVANTKTAVYSHFSNEGYPLRTKGKAYRRVKRIIDKLTVAAGLKKSTYPLYIAESGDDVNAMAVNDNTIVVYSELVKRVKQDDQLSTVLAHEIAHILAKHGADDTTESRSAWVGLGSAVIGAAAGVGTVLVGGGSYLSDVAADTAQSATSAVAEGAFVRSYDRKLEYEADHVGLMIMAKAGYDPRAAVKFWERSEEIFGSSGGMSFFSTHPSGDNRVSEIEEALPAALEYYSGSKSGKSSKKK